MSLPWVWLCLPEPICTASLEESLGGQDMASEPDSEAWLLMQSEPRNTDRGMIQGSGENKYKPEAAREKERHRTRTLKYS